MSLVSRVRAAGLALFSRTSVANASGLPAGAGAAQAINVETDPADVAAANSDRPVNSLIALQGSPPTAVTRNGRNVRELGWERHPVVYACGSVIANLAGAIPFEAYRKAGNEERSDPRSRLQVLLDRPAYRMSAMRLRLITALQFILYGNSFWFLVRDRPGKPPTSIYLIPPEDIQYCYTNSLGYPLFYVWRDRFGKQHTSSAEDIMHYRDLVADGKPFGYPRGAAALIDIQTDSEASNYVRQIVNNDGTPLAAIITEDTTPEMLAAAEARFHEKVVRRGQRGRLPFLSGIKDVKVFGFNLRELEFPELRQVTREDICAALGVDPRIISLASASKDGGLSGVQYREARQKLVLHTVEPLMQSICSEIDLWLAPEYGDVYARPSQQRLANILEDETQTSSRVVSEFSGGLRSFQESRRVLGLSDEPQQTDLMKMGADLIPFAIAPIDEADVVPPPLALAPGAPVEPGADGADGAEGAAGAAGADGSKGADGAPAPAPADTAKSAPLTDEVRASTLAQGRVLTRGVLLSASQRTLLWSQFDERARSEEAEYRRAARLIFEDERGSVAKIFANAAAKYATADKTSGRATPPTKPSVLELEDRYIAEAWKRIRAEYKTGGVYHQRWLDRYRTLIGKTYAAGGTEIGARLGFDFNLMDKAVQDAISVRADQLASFVTETTATHVNAAIKSARKAGQGIGETARLIDRAVFGQTAIRRSVRIARTETVGALNQGEYDTALAAGVSQSKEWLTQGDTIVRDGEPGDGNHVILDGVRVKIREPFSNKCHHPGDRSNGAPASETIQCRCTLLYYDEVG